MRVWYMFLITGEFFITLQIKEILELLNLPRWDVGSALYFLICLFMYDSVAAPRGLFSK